LTKRGKRESAIRRNPKGVRFDDLDSVLRDTGFVRGQAGGSHVAYRHSRYAIRVTVVMPHTGERFVKAYQVEQALAAIDAARAREGTAS
jgi:predicted RNA binding protein YcfA (HicA-like mRNA interferase family)